MKNKPIIDVEKALQEKETMQKHFVRKHEYKCPILILLIEHFRGQLKK